MEYNGELKLKQIGLLLLCSQGLLYVWQLTLSTSMIPIRSKMFFGGWISHILQIFCELIFVLWFPVSVSQLKGTFFLGFFFLFFFFPTTAQWVISSVLFSRFWLLHSAVVITEFHVASNLQSMWGYCISNSKEDTSRGRTVLDILNLKRRAPDSHFSFPRSAVLPSQNSHPWPTKKLPPNSPNELYLFFHISSLDSSWAQCINKRLIHTFTLKPSKDPKAYESSQY